MNNDETQTYHKVERATSPEYQLGEMEERMKMVIAKSEHAAAEQKAEIRRLNDHIAYIEEKLDRTRKQLELITMVARMD